MKRSFFALIIVSVLLSGCAAVQSIVRSTFPYTAELGIPKSSKINTSQSVSSQASSFDQIFTGQGSNTNAITDLRLSSVKITANFPSGQSLGVFESVKIYLSRGDSSKEILIATRDNIAATIGNIIMLDADTTLVLDQYIKESTVRIRMEYVLRSELSTDINLKASIGFIASPNQTK